MPGTPHHASKFAHRRTFEVRKFAEEECMWDGATIRNTFIHYPDVGDDEQDSSDRQPEAHPSPSAASLRRRTRSVPASMRCSESLRLPARVRSPPVQRSRGHQRKVRGGPQEYPRGRRTPSSAESASGSTASFGEGKYWGDSSDCSSRLILRSIDSSTSNRSHSPDSEDNQERASSRPAYSLAAHSSTLGADYRATAARIVEMMHKHCSFMRIRGHGVYPENGERMRLRGIAATLRFYVRGLPWAKRAKWLQPLQRSVAAVLQNVEPWIIVRGGVLFAPIDVRASEYTAGSPKRQTLAEFYEARPDLPQGDHAMIAEALTMADCGATARSECTLEHLTMVVGCVGMKKFVASLPASLGVRHGAALARFLPRLKADVCMRIDFAAARL